MYIYIYVCFVYGLFTRTRLLKRGIPKRGMRPLPLWRSPFWTISTRRTDVAVADADVDAGFAQHRSQEQVLPPPSLSHLPSLPFSLSLFLFCSFPLLLFSCTHQLWYSFHFCMWALQCVRMRWRMSWRKDKTISRVLFWLGYSFPLCDTAWQSFTCGIQ